MLDNCDTCLKLDVPTMWINGLCLCYSCAELTITAEITHEDAIIEDLEEL